MSFKSILIAGAFSLTFATSAFASEIMLQDAYARAATPTAATGAAFLIIMNHSGQADRLIGVASPVAERVELHTHEEDDSGVMRMRHVVDGFALPADGEIRLQRGGHHIMFMGLKEPFEQGKMIPVVLSFEKAGEIETEIKVDLERKADHGMSHDHDHSAD